MTCSSPTLPEPCWPTANISDNQLSYITNVDFGRGLIKCGSAIVPFLDVFPKHTRLYKLMSTKLSEQAA